MSLGTKKRYSLGNGKTSYKRQHDAFVVLTEKRKDGADAGKRKKAVIGKRFPKSGK